MGRETIPPRNLIPSRSHWWNLIPRINRLAPIERVAHQLVGLRVCLRVLRRGMNKGIFAGIILIVCVGILVASFAAYSEISVVRVEAKSIISAPTSVLWQIMMEVDKYPRWYSVMLEAGGTPRLGAKLRFRVKAMDGSTRQLSFTGTVVEFVPERRLVWTGGMFPILMGRHFFEFVLLALRPAYDRFNQELAARAASRHE